MDSPTYTGINFDESLLNLIKEGEYKRLKEILIASSEYDGLNDIDTSLLHYSVHNNNVNLTEYLLADNCNANLQDSMGNTPMIIALMKNFESIIKILLANDADIFKLRNIEGKSALHIFGEQYKMNNEIIELFLQDLQRKCSSCEEIGKQLVECKCHIYQAIFLRNAKIIKYMLHHHTPVDYIHPTSKVTGMHVAVRLNCVEIVELLSVYNSNVNAQDFMNANPLFYVYTVDKEHNEDKLKILKILVDQGASMTSCVYNGAFNTYYTLTNGNSKAIRILLESGLDFNAQDQQSSKNVLHYLVNNKDPEVVEELKLHIEKLNINSVDKFGQSPLTLAVIVGNVGMVKFLLKQNAKSDVKHNVFGATPLYYACRCTEPGSETQYRQCIELLLEYKADPQVIVVKKSGKIATVFDAALEDENFKRMKPVISYLAILEKLGTPITKTIWEKIHSHSLMQEYFEKSKRLLNEPISGRLVLFDLLISNKEKMGRYLNDKDLFETVRDQCQKLQSLDCQYYSSQLNKHLLKGNRYKKLTNKVARIITTFFQHRIHKKHLVVENIIKYLNHKSLCQLARLHYQLLHRHITSRRNNS